MDRLAHGCCIQYTLVGSIFLKATGIHLEVAVAKNLLRDLPISSHVALGGDQRPYPFSDSSSWYLKPKSKSKKAGLTR